MVRTQPEHSAIKIRSEVLHRLDYCQELFPGGAVILLSGGESFTVIGYYFPAFLDLRQHSTDIVVAGTCIQGVFPG